MYFTVHDFTRIVELITTAIHALTCCEKEVELNMEMIHISTSMPISYSIPFYFLQSSRVYYFTSNYMSSLSLRCIVS